MKDYLFNFQPHKDGLESVLGELESAIMALIWAKAPITVRQVHQDLAHNRTIAYTTVMTVMSRLAEKGLLHKEKDGNAFVYRAVLSEEEFKRKTRGKIIDALLGAFGTPVISQFVETVGREHPEKMAELARLVAKKREAEGKTPDPENQPSDKP